MPSVFVHCRFCNALPNVLDQHPTTTAKTPRDSSRLTLLLADTDGTTSSASSLGVLTSDTETPVVSQTTVGSDLLQTLQILTQLAFHTVGQHLVVLAIDNIALSVEEPFGDLVLSRVLDDGDNSFEFFGSDFTGTRNSNQLSLLEPWVKYCPYRLFKSTSAFLQTKLE